MVNQCLQCGIIFDAHKRQKCCSKKCYEITVSEIRSNAFASKFNKLYCDEYEYIGGYKGSEQSVNIRCIVCGNERIVTAQCIRDGHRLINCTECHAEERQTERKKQIDKQRQTNKEISAKKREQAKQLKMFIKNNTMRKSYVKNCEECGQQYITIYQNQKTCAQSCRSKRQSRNQEVSRRHKLRDNGRIDWDISLTKLAKRDNMICHICGSLVTLDGYANAADHGSIDHVIPVSKGGTHTWCNVRLAHRDCNARKRDSTQYIIVNGQVAIAM